MRINEIKVKNFLGIREAEINTSAPVIFVSGNNGAGKSSFRDAISMALTGDLSRISLKKNADLLLHDGAESSEIHIKINEEDHKGFYARIKKGKTADCADGDDVSPVLRCMLNPGLFASLTADDKRNLLFEVTGCSSTGDEIKQRLLDRGLAQDLVDQITPLLRLGFAEAHKESQSRSRDCKSGWRAITGETYGEKKAEGWQSKVNGNPVEIRSSIEEKEKELSAIDSSLEDHNRKLGAAQSVFDKARLLSAEIVRLTDQAEKVDRIRSTLDTDRKQVEHWREMVEKTRRQTHDITEDEAACRCPECDAELIFTGGKLIPHGDLRGDEEAAVKLPEYERALSVVENAVRNGERDLENAISAQNKLAILRAESSDAPDEESVRAMKAGIDKLKEESKRLAAHVAELRVLENAIQQASANTAKAAEYHRKAQSWSEIAAALAPDGIPAEILREALEPFRARLSEAAGMIGWSAPAIDDDMNITAAGREYGLLSESEKWRVDFLIAEAIGYLSGWLRLLVADRIDVLDGSGRAELFQFLDQYQTPGTVIVMGTLKKDQAKMIADVFKNISVHWMEAGVLSEVSPVEAKEVA